MKKYATELEWAGIITLVSLVWMALERWLGWHDEHIDQHAVYTLFFMPITFGLYYFALRAKRDQDLGGRMTWKEGFASGMVLSGFLVLLNPLVTLITHRLITPDFFDNMIEHSVRTNRLSRPMAEKIFSLGSYLLQGVVGTIIIGALFSAIIAAILRKKQQGNAAAM